MAIAASFWSEPKFRRLLSVTDERQRDRTGGRKKRIAPTKITA
jgi:hypothetical protein